MGMDFDCGCRKSMMGGWTLCERHEVQLFDRLKQEKKMLKGGKYVLKRVPSKAKK